jgi:hypothetical protein
MIIKRIAVGNNKEAYVENSLRNGINIISSDDNNKGKTIIIQSMMYCLGNAPVFPSSFDYKMYFYFVEFAHNDCDYSICRRGDTFVILHERNLMFFDSVSEMKRYWTKTVFPLPQIIKNDVKRIVDPELFVQLYFVGQDKKDTSNIANKGFYSKDDFINMIYTYAGFGAAGLTQEEISHAKDRIRELKEEKRTLQTQHKILKSNNVSSAYLSQYSDRVILENKIKSVEKVKDQIAALRNSRNTTINRKLKYEVTLKELNSLNRTMNSGELRCLDCGSAHIGFATGTTTSYTFDVSTPEIRRQIIDSINEKIASYIEEVEHITFDINKAQEQLQQMLTDEDISLESIVIHKQSILDVSGVEIRLSEIDDEVQKLSDAMKTNETNSLEQVENQKMLLSSILYEMNSTYRRIDPTGTLVFDGLFTRRDQVFSGSEATEFHLVKLYALSAILKHLCPIIVDSFRAEDLSTERENTVIDLFSHLDKQVIFTTTLKIEEIGKYQHMKNINNIDYSKKAPSKILNTVAVVEFSGLLKKLSINI